MASVTERPDDHHENHDQPWQKQKGRAPSQATPGTVADTLLNDAKNQLYFNMQPIINGHSGSYFGIEAQLQGYQHLDFDRPDGLLGAAALLGIQHRLVVILLEKAIAAFAKLRPAGRGIMLFINLGSRLAESPDYEIGITQGLLDRHNLPRESVVFELPGGPVATQSAHRGDLIKGLRAQNFRLAFSGFGATENGLADLYHWQPDFVKISPFFIDNVNDDKRKRQLLSSIIKLAHVLGTTVIAEGVTSQNEFRTVRDLGADMVQGPFTFWAQGEMTSIPAASTKIVNLNNNDRREMSSDVKIIFEQIEALEPLSVMTEMSDVFERFRAVKDRTYFPVVDLHHAPVGLIREKDLKHYAYSAYGKDLISNKAYGHKLRDFATPCPTADIKTDAEAIMELFSISDGAEGIIITRDTKYLGFLSAASLLRVVNEKNLSFARDQNPLSKLPGNNVINQYLSRLSDAQDQSSTLVYFDFDHFKPFNDSYGFRQGDRAILLFADLMRKQFPSENTFIGHVGGDDFFAAFEGLPFDHCIQQVRSLLQRFQEDVRSFYSEPDRERGYIAAKNRQGEPAMYPLLSCSAAVLDLPPHRARNLEAILAVMTDQKKMAKSLDDGLSVASFTG